jgi:hypothetical protein
VVVDYKDVPVAVAAGIYTEGLLGGRQEQDMLLFASRAESRPESNEGGQMTPEQRKSLCASLGLAEDADNAAIQAKLREADILQASTGEDETPEDDDDADDGDDDGEEEATTAEADLPATVTVEASAFRQMQEDAKLARALHEKSIRSENDLIMRDAVRAGKFAPAVAASVRKQLDNPGTREATVKWIAECAEGVVPTAPVGSSAAGDEVEGAEVNEGLPWFSREHQRAQRMAQASAEGRVMSDGRYARDGGMLKAGVN